MDQRANLPCASLFISRFRQGGVICLQGELVPQKHCAGEFCWPYYRKAFFFGDWVVDLFLLEGFTGVTNSFVDNLVVLHFNMAEH